MTTLLFPGRQTLPGRNRSGQDSGFSLQSYRAYPGYLLK